MDSLNSTDLGPGDHVSVLDLDAAGSDGLYGLRQLRPVGGPSELRLHGFDAEAVDESTLRFFLINHRVPVGAAGRRIPAEAIGANSTMEVYDVERGSEEMRHVRTVYDPSTIYTPNKIAVLGDGGFLLTNDHSRKTGLRKNLELVLRGGSITYCDASFKCREVKKDGMAFPNGLVRGHDGLIYVPSSAGETALVLRFHPKNGSMTEVAQLKLGYPVDNFVVDQLGDIYAAALPKAYISIGHFKNASVEPPATVLKISKDKGAYTVKKVLEDRDGEVISGIASACHDAKTGMVFLGGQYRHHILLYDLITALVGLILPFVSVCVRA